MQASIISSRIQPSSLLGHILRIDQQPPASNESRSAINYFENATKQRHPLSGLASPQELAARVSKIPKYYFWGNICHTRDS
ncbi:hypothetical protein CTI12_AA507040 [Artemisia annua]|uniref:Uncharacterized protein n=1 Tax=Artemisia annua TaxID=35608 RepID=A0A2U1LC83_ARTAN|nr:hypothetical protein CTI12_AA507040 [Artemisia annua]